MAGIYIHIPFCRQKCNYCNFFSLATTKFRDAFFQALLKEIELTSDYLGDEPVETIYFGGGTPSLLTVRQLEEILQGIRDAGYGMPDAGCRIRVEGRGSREKDEIKKYEVQNTKIENRKSKIGDCEITLETNPDDVTPDYLETLSNSSINRISLGVQSFFDEDLQYLSRSHDAEQAERALTQIRDTGYGMWDKGQGSRVEGRGEKFVNRKSGFVNLSVDLIYGIPTLTNEHWRANLRRVIDLGIPHLSAYALTVEPKTPLAWQIRKGADKRTSGPVDQWTSGQWAVGNQDPVIRHPVSDDQASEQFDILMDMMEQAGYIQYEISNFCLPGFESRHNSNYWRGAPYLGLGPSAHSYNGTSRRWNISNLTSYIRHLVSGILPIEEEILTPVQQYNEYVMTSLRTINGASSTEISRQFGPEFAEYFRHQAIRHEASGHLKESSGIYTLTKKGKFLSDGIAADLFWVEEV